MKPVYRLVVESTVFSNVGEVESFTNPLSSLSITDKIGNVADTLDFSLVFDGSYATPETKGVCEVSLGYEGGRLPPGIQSGLWEVGRYIVSEVDLDVSRQNGKVLSVRALSMPASPETFNSLQNSHHRSWQSYALKETTFATIVEEVCQGAGLTAEIDSDVASIQMPGIWQTGETDATFLTRLSGLFDVSCKYHDQSVIFVKKDKAQLPTLNIEASDNIVSYRHSTSVRSDIKQVEAQYRDAADNAVKMVSAGSGEPKYIIKEPIFPTEIIAQESAKTLLAHMQRNTENISITLPTIPNLRAETPINLSGFDGDADGDYICYEVAHRFGASGLVSTVTAKKRVQL